MRYGTGIQNKVLEAMACSTPVVASMQVCTAIDAVHGEDLLVAETYERIADGVVRLLDDQRLRERVGSRGRAYVEAKHDGRVLVERLEAVYAGLV
jgi:glycosyltransferase involved in cell wall biosynthesis